jgi:hypothetical protein
LASTYFISGGSEGKEEAGGRTEHRHVLAETDAGASLEGGEDEGGRLGVFDEPLGTELVAIFPQAVKEMRCGEGWGDLSVLPIAQGEKTTSCPFSTLVPSGSTQSLKANLSRRERERERERERQREIETERVSTTGNDCEGDSLSLLGHGGVQSQDLHAEGLQVLAGGDVLVAQLGLLSLGVSSLGLEDLVDLFVAASLLLGESAEREDRPAQGLPVGQERRGRGGGGGDIGGGVSPGDQEVQYGVAELAVSGRGAI